MSTSVRVDSKGRLVIPLELRKSLGIEPGDTLYVESDGKRILQYAKAENPFDVLVENGLAEHQAGRTRRLREIMVDCEVVDDE